MGKKAMVVGPNQFDWYQPIKERNELPRLVAATPPGTKTSVKVLREGKEKTLSITVTELKEERFAAESEETEDESTIGLVVEDVDPRLARLKLSQFCMLG